MSSLGVSMNKLLGFRWMAAARPRLRSPHRRPSPTRRHRPATTASVKLFEDWRTFERPPLRDGAPDYTAATFARRHAELPAWQARLAAIDTAAWPVEARVDHRLVAAEMNGFDFYVRVLKPWERDPAFYLTVWDEQSDTPAHEGRAPRDRRRLEVSVPARPRGRGEARRRARRHPAAQRPGAPEPDRQCPRPLGHRRRDHAQADRLARRAREAHRGQRPGAQAGDRGGAGHRRSHSSTGWTRRARRRPARPASAAENYSWALQERLPGADDLGTRKCRSCGASSRAPTPRSRRRKSAIATCRRCRRSARPRSSSDAATRRSRAISRSCATASCTRCATTWNRRSAPDGQLRADRDAQLLRDRDALRAAHALHALLPLVGPRADARRAAPEPDPARAPCSTTSGTAAPRAWRPRWRSSC